MPRAEDLMRIVQTSPGSADDGRLANELLREFHRGFPILRLQPLLVSQDERVVRVGAFLASELGGKAKPLLPTMLPLLHSQNKHIRADVIGSILTCTNGENEAEIGAVILLLADADWPIRWKVMEFMSLASVEQLQAGLQLVEQLYPGSDHDHGLHWLISDDAKNPISIASWLNSDRQMRRKYGVVAAARVARTTLQPLQQAVLLDDSDVRQFAASKLQIVAEGGS